MSEAASAAVAAVAGAAVLAVAAAATMWWAWRRRDAKWRLHLEELEFSDPPRVLGTGSSGRVVRATFRGTEVLAERCGPRGFARALVRARLLAILCGNVWLPCASKADEAEGTPRRRPLLRSARRPDSTRGPRLAAVTAGT